MGSSSDPEASVRVVVQHFALPRYRLPVFRELARTPGIALKVVYGEVPGLSNQAPEGFDATRSAVRRFRTPFGFLTWNSSQWANAHRGRADVLVLTWNIRSLTLIPALLRARRKGVRTLLWGHGYSRRDTVRRKLLRRSAAKLADGLIFYGDREAERFVAATGRSRAAFVAPNSLDQTPIQKAREVWLGDRTALSAFQRENDLADRLTALFVSRYKPENRLDLLISAAAGSRQRHPDLAVVIIGDGNQEQPHLRELVERLNLQDMVRFVGPVYDEHALAPWFLSADVFCYPSNLGLSVLHAFGYGLPVVTGDRENKSPPEWQAVKPDVNGLHFTHGDAASLTETLSEVLADAPLRQRLGEAARRTALEEYSMDRMVHGLREAIDYCRRL